MQVKQDSDMFRPITIILETSEEYYSLLELIVQGKEYVISPSLRIINKLESELAKYESK